MSAAAAVQPVKRGRGRPPKIKRVMQKPVGGTQDRLPSIPSESLVIKPFDVDTNMRKAVEAAMEPVGSQSLSSEPLKSAGSKRSSPDDQDYTQSTKRPRPTLPVHSQLEKPYLISRKPKSIGAILPARRSARQATVHSTQVSEGTLRPPGPPALEAALNIALRNLESETWRYLWSYHKNHRGKPLKLPTPTAIKEACPRVRKAAAAVDKADRELEDAIDEIMDKTSRKKRRSGGRRTEKSSGVEIGSQQLVMEAEASISLMEEDGSSDTMILRYENVSVSISSPARASSSELSLGRKGPPVALINMS
ncbi:hypothetical protein K439DRAFT_1158545 [Ramaria rubella]|nr:hypothetical protein K439DRAFT_1158545 [Ramaria rubella]